MSTRLDSIIELIKVQGRVSVEELSELCNVSVQTIRKDLNVLESQRLISRVHGGAVPSSGVENLKYNARRAMAAHEKTAIGEAVAKLIPNGSSLFIDIGTTTEACATALLGHSNLMIITNNINVASEMRSRSNHEVVIVGGIVRHSDGGIVGGAAVDFIRQFRVDYAIIGISSIDDDGSLMDYDLHEVKVAQAILDNARHTILATDSTKFARKAPVKVAGIDRIHSFVTDFCPSKSVKQLCKEHNIKLIETGLSSKL